MLGLNHSEHVIVVILGLHVKALIHEISIRAFKHNHG